MRCMMRCMMHSPKGDLNEKPDWDPDQKRLRPDTDRLKSDSSDQHISSTVKTAEEKKNLTGIRSDHRSTVAAAAMGCMGILINVSFDQDEFTVGSARHTYDKITCGCGCQLRHAMHDA